MANARLPISYSTRRRWTETDARTVLAALDSSGLSVTAFATREGLEPQRLYFWRQRLGGSSAESAAPTFVEVQQRHTAREQVEIVLRSGRVVRVAESIEPAVLRGLIDVLEQDSSC